MWPHPLVSFIDGPRLVSLEVGLYDGQVHVWSLRKMRFQVGHSRHQNGGPAGWFKRILVLQSRLGCVKGINSPRYHLCELGSCISM